MEQVFIYIAIVLTVIISIPFIRVVKGPTLFDRLLGVGTIGSKTIVIICVVGFVFNRVDMFIDIALTYAILNFIGTIAIAKYFSLERKEYD